MLSLVFPPAGEAEAAADSGRLLVNKRELAGILGCSLPKLQADIDRHGDFPVVRRGSNGVEWQFDGEAVVAWYAARAEAERAAEQARIDQAAQLAMPIDSIVDDEAKGLDPQKRLAWARARATERDLAIKARLLVPTSEVRQVFGAAFADLARSLQAFVRQLGRDHDWSAADRSDAEARLAGLQEAFVRRCADLLPDGEAASGGDLFGA